MKFIISLWALMVGALCSAVQAQEDYNYLNYLDTNPNKVYKAVHFRVGMQRCPPGFIDQLAELVDKSRAQHGADPLAYSYPLANYSQEYVQYLQSQPHEVSGQQPNNQYGQIVYTADVDQNDVVICHKHILARYAAVIEGATYSYYGTEPPADDPNSDSYADFTRLIWRSSRHIGFGCGLEQPPGINSWRAIVVITFDRQPEDCGYKRNVLPEVTSDLYANLTALGADNIPADPSCLPPAPPPPPPCPACPTCPPLPPPENCPQNVYDEVLQAINDLRTQNSLNPVVLDQSISDYSLPWARFLVRRNLWLPQPNNTYNDLIYSNIEDDVNALENLDGQSVINFWAQVDLDLGNPEVSSDDSNIFSEYFEQLLNPLADAIGIGCAIQHVRDDEVSPFNGQYRYYVVVNFRNVEDVVVVVDPCVVSSTTTLAPTTPSTTTLAPTTTTPEPTTVDDKLVFNQNGTKIH